MFGSGKHSSLTDAKWLWSTCVDEPPRSRPHIFFPKSLGKFEPKVPVQFAILLFFDCKRIPNVRCKEMKKNKRLDKPKPILHLHYLGTHWLYAAALSPVRHRISHSFFTTKFACAEPPSLPGPAKPRLIFTTLYPITTSTTVHTPSFLSPSSVFIQFLFQKSQRSDGDRDERTNGTGPTCQVSLLRRQCQLAKRNR